MPEPLSGVSLDNHGDSATITHDSPQALLELCAKVHAKVDAFLKREPKTERLRSVQEQSKLSLSILEETLERYSLDELSLSYNGGKDCLVLLILYLAALHAHFSKTLNHRMNGVGASEQHQFPRRLPYVLQTVYIVSKHPFPQVDSFVNDSVRAYHLDLVRYAKPMKEAFTEYLHEHPKIKAIFVGTRRTDPHGASLKHFDPTDHGWPEFMRIHPVIDWHYAEIWTFIRELEIPYCSLYDLGYTSLGGTMDTHPNPVLRLKDVGEDDGKQLFRPAYELKADDEERLGRDG